MQYHVEALFTHDADGSLLRVNEPDGAPAPRFFLGRTVDATLLGFRHDVGQDARRALRAAAKNHARAEHHLESPIEPAPYQDILARFAPVTRTWTGPAFSFPDKLPVPAGVVPVTEANVQLLRPFFEGWIPDVRQCQPMFVVAVDGQAVSLCGSVRQTNMAHEAGVETAAPHRGRGYAVRVVAAWARTMHDTGRVPLYSTSWENEASRAVARSLALTLFGNDVHIS